MDSEPNPGIAATDEGTSDVPTWRPDRETVLWWMGAAHEDRIADSLQREVTARGEGLATDSPEYWRLVAEVAVEHLTFDLFATAKKWGTDFTTNDGAQEQRNER